jgi:uncharacterized protein (TIGR00369 family)
MVDQTLSQQDLTLLRDIFFNQLPFNKLLGLQIELDHGNPTQAQISFVMRDELIGNPLQRILHGGVISSTLDTAGGLVACLGMFQKLSGSSREELLTRLGRLGTIDLRVDYLRPGRGERFIATGYILRTGNKVAVTRMELHNETDVLIAVGTGTYLVG